LWAKFQFSIILCTPVTSGTLAHLIRESDNSMSFQLHHHLYLSPGHCLIDLTSCGCPKEKEERNGDRDACPFPGVSGGPGGGWTPVCPITILSTSLWFIPSPT